MNDYVLVERLARGADRSAVIQLATRDSSTGKHISGQEIGVSGALVELLVLSQYSRLGRRSMQTAGERQTITLYVSYL